MDVNTSIKIKDLITYPFPIQKKPVDVYSLEYIIQNLKIDYYDIDSSKFNPEFFQIKEIYDNPHDSDEQSYRYLLFFKGEFVCIYGYTGDRGTETVLFISFEKKIALRDYFLSLTTDYADTSDILEEEFDLSDQYTLFYEYQQEFYYSIFNPYWSYCFGKDEPLYYIEDNDTLTPVKFVEFKINPRKVEWGERYKSENQFAIVQKEGGYKFQASFDRITFKVSTAK